MDPLKDFETSNALQWDQESTITTSTELSPALASTNPATQSNVGHVAPLSQVAPLGQQSINRQQILGSYSGIGGRSLSTSRETTPSPAPHRQSYQSNGNLNSRAPNNDHRQPQHGSEQRRSYRATPAFQSSADSRVKLWAKPKGLVTTRMENTNVVKEKENAEIKKYLGSVNGQEDYQATGYYLWPKKGVNPRELLGWKLEKLDVLRKTFKVIIEWDDRKQCLTINSDRPTADHDIMATIKGIRQAVQNCNAEIIFASPQYIVAPPSADVMRTVIGPKYDDGKIMGVELAGRQFSEQEKETWDSKRSERLEENLTKFREHLIKHTTLLAPLMGWMRMRVHFGHVRFGKVREEFVQSKYCFDEFVGMMELSRVRTSGKFDRKLDDATLGKKMLQKIIESPHIFCPVQSRIPSLQDVKPKHMEIIFVNIPDGENLRIEAEVDQATENGLGQYQIGTTRLFRDSRRNKRVEVTTIDIERKFDWTLEIITDGSIADLPSTMLSLIEGSLSGKSKEREDCLGLSYPGVSPSTQYGLDVRNVVVRSVYQYMLKETGYIVEIAVYREWDGCNTAKEPKMLSSVSMFHPVWDGQMDSIEYTTKERDWDRQLRCFFEGPDQNGGIPKFMEDVILIQGLLTDAARASTGSPKSSQSR